MPRLSFQALNETVKLAELDPEINAEIQDGAHYKKVKSFRPKIEHSIPAYLEMTATKLIESELIFFYWFSLPR